MYIQGQTGAKARAEGHRGAMQQTKEKRLAAFAYLIVKKITKIKQKEEEKKTSRISKEIWKRKKNIRGNQIFTRKWTQMGFYREKKSAHIVIVCRGQEEEQEKEGEGMDQLAALLLLVNS